MTVADSFRGGGARGIARFLAGHQGCDAGFDVARDRGQGSGRLRITCKGCGASIEYRAAEARNLADAEARTLDGARFGSPREPAAVVVSGAPIAGPAASAAGSGRAAGEADAERARGRLPSLAIAAIIVAGACLIAIGLLRGGGQGDGDAARTPTIATGPAPGSAGAAAPSRGSGAPTQGNGANPGNAPSEPRPRLSRRSVLGRFSLGVPAGWEQGVVDGAFVVSARGGRAEVRVFFQRGGTSLSALGSSASGFLASEHPGATVSRSRRGRCGERRGIRVAADYASGSELACVLRAGGYSYLVLRRVDNGADPAIRAAARASFASFRPA
jgi:hypothetical protein